MLPTNVILSLALVALTLSGANTAACRAKQEERATGATTPTPVENRNANPAPPAPAATPERDAEGNVIGEIKTLAEGQNAPVEDAFIVVARDGETYAALRALVGGLPDMKADFFDENTVVAAFLGTRNTGGYSVEVSGSGTNGVRLAEKTPTPGGLTSQALTAPFKVVSVPRVGDRTLPIEVGETWTRALRSYQVKSGGFTTGGGFAGIFESFSLEGTLGTLRHGSLITVVFNLKSVGAEKERALRNIATGKVDGGNVSLPRLDAGTLVDQPNDGLRATGRFTPGDASLSLVFEPHPTRIADGYGGNGKLEADGVK